MLRGRRNAGAIQHSLEVAITGNFVRLPKGASEVAITGNFVRLPKGASEVAITGNFVRLPKGASPYSLCLPKAKRAGHTASTPLYTSIKRRRSDDFLPSAPRQGDKPAACQGQTRQSRTDDRAGDRY
jgi:hypothetical protein